MSRWRKADDRPVPQDGRRRRAPRSRRRRRSVAEAKAALGKFQAEVDRWDIGSQADDGGGQEGGRRSPDPPRVDQSAQVEHRLARRANRRRSWRRWPTSSPGRPTRRRPRSTSRVARAAWSWPRATRSGSRRWVGYLTLTAPFDGVIVARNVNTGDFVLPATGDPSATARSPDQSAARATPLYVVDRTRHPPDLRRRPRGGRRLRPHRHQGDRARPRLPRPGDARPASRGPPGPSTSRAGRSAPRSTCTIPTPGSCPACTPTAR